jgi:hypothetical protein
MQNKPISLFITVLLLFLPSCNTYRVTKNDPYGRYNVINPKWTIKTAQPNPENLIQYDCVYVRKMQSPDEYEAYRFWPTGQVMGRHLTSADLNNLDIQMSVFYYSWGDYYKIEGKNFTIESFNSLYHTFRKGYIDGDENLIMTESGVADSRFTKWAEPQKFLKIKANLRPLEPDW